MNNFTKEIQTALLSNELNLNEIFRHQLELAVNQLLQAELSAVLGYESYERSSTDNYRNGSYERTLDTEFGKIIVNIPRDRNGEFKNPILPKYSRRNDALEDTIITLYSKGITTREIGNLIEEMYGHHYSPTTVSNITNQVEDLVKDYHNHQFKQTKFVAVFLDATYIPLRRGTVAKEAVYVALGIDSSGQKEILDYTIAPSENGEVWTELLLGLKSRGITDIQLFISDGMVGIQNAISSTYPNAKYQRCWVHVERQLMNNVRKDDRKAVIDDFKKVRQADSKDSAKQLMSEFIKTWDDKYHRLMQKLADYQDLFTFFDFPPQIRGTIYSTNIIESFNKSAKRKIKRKEQFPNEAALDRFFVTHVIEYNDKFEGKSHKGFKSCSDTLESLFI